MVHAREWPDANCLPPGISVLSELLAPFKIIQEPELVVILYERFRRPDFGHLDLQLTIDDPKAYTKPWTVNLLPLHFDGDNELLEDVCNENEKDLKHLVGK